MSLGPPPPPSPSHSQPGARAPEPQPPRSPIPCGPPTGPHLLPAQSARLQGSGFRVHPPRAWEAWLPCPPPPDTRPGPPLTPHGGQDTLEVVLHEPESQAGLAHRATSQEDQLEHRGLARRHPVQLRHALRKHAASRGGPCPQQIPPDTASLRDRQSSRSEATAAPPLCSAPHFPTRKPANTPLRGTWMDGARQGPPRPEEQW